MTIFLKINFKRQNNFFCTDLCTNKCPDEYRITKKIVVTVLAGFGDIFGICQ